MKTNQPKTFYGYKIDASQPFELQIHLPLDYDVKEGQVIRIGKRASQSPSPIRPPRNAAVSSSAARSSAFSRPKR